MIKGLEHLYCEGTLIKFGLFSLEKILGELTASSSAFSTSKGYEKVGEVLFMRNKLSR